MPLIEGILFHTIFGVIGFAVAMFYLAKAVKRLLRINSDRFEWGIAGLSFVIAIFTFSTLGRYQFEREIREEIDGTPWAIIVDEQITREIYEPLTWFYPPTDYFKVVARDNPLNPASFWVKKFRYANAQESRLIDANCDERTYTVSRPSGNKWTGEVDSKGFFIEHPMTNEEYGLFCQYDWHDEMIALKEATLNEAHK